MTTGIVLAAGRSSRAGCIKALARLGGLTFVERTVRALREGGCAFVIVVVGPPFERDVRAALHHDDAIVFARNPAPERGMFSSVSCALERLDVAAPNDVVLALVDHPRVRPETIRALIEASATSEALWLRPRHARATGHPILIRRAALQRLRIARPDSILREVLRAHPSQDVAVDDPHVLEDADTRAEIAALRSRRGSTPAR